MFQELLNGDSKPVLIRILGKKKLTLSDKLLAEKEGFEPPVPRGTTVFKTAAFDRSAISPLQK